MTELEFRGCSVGKNAEFCYSSVKQCETEAKRAHTGEGSMGGVRDTAQCSPDQVNVVAPLRRTSLCCMYLRGKTCLKTRRTVGGSL